MWATGPFLIYGVENLFRSGLFMSYIMLNRFIRYSLVYGDADRSWLHFFSYQNTIDLLAAMRWKLGTYRYTRVCYQQNWDERLWLLKRIRCDRFAVLLETTFNSNPYALPQKNMELIIWFSDTSDTRFSDFCNKKGRYIVSTSI